jgi:hypothetical protein
MADLAHRRAVTSLESRGAAVNPPAPPVGTGRQNP